MTNKPPPIAAALRRPIAARSPSSRPTGHGWTAALVVALGLAAPTQGQAGPITYSFTDGQISGTLDGVAFAAASYTITATGDSAGVVSGNAGGTLPYYLQAVTTTIAIWGFSAVTFTNPNFGPLSLDLSIRSPGFGYDLLFGNLVGSDAYGFGLLFLNGTYPNLTQPLSVVSAATASIGYTFATSGGNLIVTANLNGPGVYTIDAAAPAPGTLALALLGGLALAARRRTHTRHGEAAGRD